MKISILVFCGACALSIAQVSAQIPNGGFEDWVTVGSYQDPANWITLNNATAPAGVYSCEEGTPGAVGNSFVKVTSREMVPDQPASTVPGIIVVGDPATGIGGFPYTGRPDALNGSWQYGIGNNDAGNILVLFTRWNPDTQVSDPIGTASMTITGSLTDWQTFSIPISYSSPLDPDTATIVIFSSMGAPVNGSYIWLDDLTFGPAITTGVDEQLAATSLLVYPSLASDRLNMSAEGAIAEVNVMDMTGRTVLRQAVDAVNTVLNVGTLHTGRYLVQARMADGKTVVRSFVKR